MHQPRTYLCHCSIKIRSIAQKVKNRKKNSQKPSSFNPSFITYWLLLLLFFWIIISQNSRDEFELSPAMRVLSQAKHFNFRAETKLTICLFVFFAIIQSTKASNCYWQYVGQIIANFKLIFVTGLHRKFDSILPSRRKHPKRPKTEWKIKTKFLKNVL